MASKQDILEAIRRNAPPPAELPPDGPAVTYDDGLEQFSATLTAVGGQCEVVQNLDEINAKLHETPEYSKAKVVCTLMPGVGRSHLDLDQVADPHELEDVDFAILSGRFAVAENAAVWVTDDRVKHRAIFFIPQHVALVVPFAAEPADSILDNLHQAYQRISFDKPRFGLFISGPSKTADIEQSLVIGAHGPRSLTVFFLKSE